MDFMHKASIMIFFAIPLTFSPQVPAYSSEPILNGAKPAVGQASNASVIPKDGELTESTKFTLRTMPPFLSAIAAIFSAIVALIVAIIGYLQYKAARERMRNDLFDRRFKIYEAALTMLGYVGRRGLRLSTENGQDNDQCFEYFDNIKTAPFLFREDLSNYLRHLGQSVIELMACGDRLAGLSMDDPQHEEERAAIKKMRSARLKKLLAESDTFVNRFAPYLKFKDH